MGSGKSTIGKRLAMLLRRPFVDLDQAIEKKENRSISEIFETEGEQAFREKEAACLKESIAAEGTIVALGGGTVCFGSNITWIKQHGLLIYLELSPVVLADRIRYSKQERPLLKQVSGTELLETIRRKLEERLPFYSQAHISINALNLTPQRLLQEIADAK